MKKLRNLILLPLLAIIWGCNEEQFVEPLEYGSVSGQVLNKKDGKPINKAAVRLNPSGRTLQTDTSGRFRFDTILAGKYTLQATKEAFRDELTTVDVSGNYGTATVLYMVNENPLPTEPMLVTPTTATTPTAPRTVLKWKSTDPNKDPLTYNVTITREGSTQTVTDLAADSLVLKDLAYGVTYYWQVTVSDGVNTVTGKMWSFRTGQFPDLPYLYVKLIGGSYQLVGSTDGANFIALTQAGNNLRPVASPNGRQIAFISNAETPDFHLFVMNCDGSNLRRVTPNDVPVAGLKPSELSFCWSPDGTQLLYPSNNKLYVVRSDGSGTGLQPIAQAPVGRLFAGCDWVETLTIKRIIARTTGSSIYDNRLMVMSPDGRDTVTVYSRTTSRVGNPVLSKTGDKALFSYDAVNFQNELGQQMDALIGLLTIKPSDPKGVVSPVMEVGNDSKLKKERGTNDLDPRFSPDGAKIIFTNGSNTGRGVHTVMIADFDGKNGQNRTVLSKGAEMPYWR